MDLSDKVILRLLQNDGKMNVKEIAHQVGLSPTATYERIKKLENKKVIKSYVALLNRDIIGKQMLAYCQVTLSIHRKDLIDSFTRMVHDLPEIMECHHSSGNYDFLLKVSVGDIEEFHRFVNDKLSAFDGISVIHTSFVLKSIKESTSYHL